MYKTYDNIRLYVYKMVMYCTYRGIQRDDSDSLVSQSNG